MHVPALSWLSLCGGRKRERFREGTCASPRLFPLWRIRRRAQPAVFTSLRSGDWGNPPAGRADTPRDGCPQIRRQSDYQEPRSSAAHMGNFKAREWVTQCVCVKCLVRGCEGAGDVAEAVKCMKRGEEGQCVPLAARSELTDCSGAFVCLGAKRGRAGCTVVRKAAAWHVLQSVLYFRLTDLASPTVCSSLPKQL